jgi:hypothetical protein
MGKRKLTVTEERRLAAELEASKGDDKAWEFEAPRKVAYRPGQDDEASSTDKRPGSAA